MLRSRSGLPDAKAPFESRAVKPCRTSDHTHAGAENYGRAPVHSKRTAQLDRVSLQHTDRFAAAHAPYWRRNRQSHIEHSSGLLVLWMPRSGGSVGRRVTMGIKVLLGAAAVMANTDDWYVRQCVMSLQQAQCPSYVSYSQTAHKPLTNGALGLPYMRPSSQCRTFKSDTIEQYIETMTEKISDPDLARLFQNAFPKQVIPSRSMPRAALTNRQHSRHNDPMARRRSTEDVHHHGRHRCHVDPRLSVLLGRLPRLLEG